MRVPPCIDLSAGQPAHPPALGDVFCGGFLVLNSRGVTHCTGNNVTMDGLAAQLGGDSDIGRTVVNQTGLRGTFDVTLEYTPPGAADADMSASDPSAPPSVLTALREQLGLKLESQRGQVDALAVDHVDQPSGN